MGCIRKCRNLLEIKANVGKYYVEQQSTAMIILKNCAWLIAILLCVQFDLSSTVAVSSTSDTKHHNLFAAELFQAIADKKSAENIVYSPVSIQTSLALAYLGAGGQTAEQLRRGLRLGEGDKTRVSQNFAGFIRKSFKTNTKNGPQLKMVNRIYASDKFQISKQFNTSARAYFNADAKNVNVKEAVLVRDEINEWVAKETENKIIDLIKADDIYSGTTAILVNAIYFKAEWLLPFSEAKTRNAHFKINSNDDRPVRMMHNHGRYRYAELPDLQATAIEMPYKNSNISMLIILPHDIEGLEGLESKLKDRDLNEITNKMFYDNLCVHLPKFHIEYDIDLKQPLEKMGLSSIFSKSANFDNLFDTPVPEFVGAAKHKAYLDVNEAGSEAAAASFEALECKSITTPFHADHPFFFAIRSPSTVYFAGHVTTF